MREILFRAKRKHADEWVEGLLWKKKYNTEKLLISCFPDKDDNEELFVIRPETIGQFTGLTDRNDKKIFEGDILRDKFAFNVKGEKPTAHNYKVTYGNGAFWCCNNNRPIALCMIFKYCEVIGNIYDNPELLNTEREEAAK